MKYIIIIFLLFLFLASCDTKDITYPQKSNLKLFINEIMADNQTTVPDENNEFDDWVELLNNDDHTINLKGFLLKNNTKIYKVNSNLEIAPGEHLIFWCDGDSSDNHTNFELSAVSDKIVLFDDENKIIDKLEFTDLETDVSFGRIPDGGEELGFLYPTPGTENPNPNAYYIVINEFMASNNVTVFDPDFNNAGDWIEFYNPTDTFADISGWFLTDDPAVPDKWKIPGATAVEAKGYLLVWCDQMDGQPDSVKTALHTNFTLQKHGEFIQLSRNDGTIEDSLTYGEQTTDISYGRLPDGSDNWQILENPTPGFANQ